MTQKKDEHISFRLTADDYDQTVAAVEMEQAESVAAFSRALHRAALVLYKKCGGLREMRELVDQLPEAVREIPTQGKTDHAKRR